MRTCSHSRHCGMARMKTACLAAPPGFQPSGLSTAIVEFMLLMAAEPPFVAALAAERDFEAGVLVACRDRVAAGQLGEHEHASRLEAFISQVLAVSVGLRSPTAGCSAT